MATEADTCRKFVVPKLQAAGWDFDPHSIAQQHGFIGGRIVLRELQVPWEVKVLQAIGGFVRDELLPKERGASG